MANKNLYTLSLDSIKYILGLIRDTVDLPANILDDLHIQSTTTYSSYRLDTLLKALKEENIQYCDEAISKLNKLSKEIITDKLQITNENTIYLLLTDPVNNIYEQWLLINGTPQMIGTTEMKLDSVYTKDEADDRYALLADFNTLTTSFNNLVTTVDKKIDKDNIATVLDDTVTDEQVPSARIVVDELGLKANDSEVVKKTDIATAIDLSLTDDTVPSTKAVYSMFANSLKGVKIMYLELINQFNFSNLGITSNNTITEIVRAVGNYIINNYGKAQYAILEFSANTGNTVFSKSLPNNKQACIGTVKYTPQYHTSRVQVFLTDTVNGDSYIGTFKNSDTNDIVWQKVYTTTV